MTRNMLDAVQTRLRDIDEQRDDWTALADDGFYRRLRRIRLYLLARMGR